MEKSNYRIDNEVLPQVSLTPDLEWMLQSNQVSPSMMAEVLVKEQFLIVYSLALSILDDHETAQRVAKDTLIKAIASTYRYRQELGAQAWILSIAVKTARGQLPSLGVWRALEAALKIPLVPAKQDPQLPRDEVEAELWLSVDALPLQNRLAFLLQVVHKLPPEQIARVLGQQENLIKSHLEDAVSKLRQSMAKKGFSGEFTQEDTCKQAWARSLQRRWAVSPLSASRQDQLISEIESRFGKNHNRKRRLNLFWETALLATAVLLVAGLARSASLSSPQPTSESTPTPISRRIAGSASGAAVIPDLPRARGYSSGNVGRGWNSFHEGFDDDFSLNMQVDFSALAAEAAPDTQLTDGEFTGSLDLAGVLKFWGWKGNLGDILTYLQPDARDASITPARMVAFVSEDTGYKALLRWGGDPLMLTRLVYAGFPVIIQRGAQSVSADGWKGQYEVVYAYDRDRRRVEFLNLSSPDGSGQSESFDNLIKDWRAFNYIYLVVYPQEKGQALQKVLGNQIDVQTNYRYSADKALKETTTTTGLDQFFAWFNRGTSLTLLNDFEGASQAFDQAYNIYKDLPEGKHPWQMLW